jgi:hypothetical protein
MNPLRKPWLRLLGLCACVSLLVALPTSRITPVGASPPSWNASGCDQQGKSLLQSTHPTSRTTLKRGPLPPCIPPSHPLPDPRKLTKHTNVQNGEKITPSIDPVDLRILVIAADGSEADLPAIKQVLDYLGEPYAVYVASQTPGGLTPDKLSSGPHGFYEGVILTTGALGYNNNGTWQIALSATEWQNLWNYEMTFHIRQVTWYTYPTPDYGFNWPTGAVDTRNSPINATFSTSGTPSGQALFGSYVNTANPLTIQYAYTYLATPLSDGNTYPLLTDGSGNALGAVRNYPDGRQNLALTFDSNPNLIHALVLAYGLVNWVTKGLFLGERHIYMSPQVDDVLIQDHTWPPGTPCGTNVGSPSLPSYRITGSDVKALVNWQQSKQAARPGTTAQLRLTMVFNGVGSAGLYSPDTLTPEITTAEVAFNWVCHTYNHANLDDVSYEKAASEIQQNNQVAENLGFQNYNPQNMVTPDVSGLTNTNFLKAAYDNGIRYLVSDTSQPGYNNPSPNAGIYNQYQPAILMIPRRPTKLYFNVSSPQEWLAEDNCLYPAGTQGHASTHQALLDRESQVLLLYLLQGDMDPLMFHQTNLRAYDGTHSLLSDLLDTTLAKYNSAYMLPILSPQMGGSNGSLGDRMAKWMQYTAVISSTSSLASVQLGSNGFQVGQPFTLTISAPSTLPYTQTSTLTVPVTGLSMSGAESYGGQKIAHITLSPGQTYTVKGTIAGP